MKVNICGEKNLFYLTEKKIMMIIDDDGDNNINNIIIMIMTIIIITTITTTTATIIFLNFTWFLFVNKRIYDFSSTLTVIASVVGHITRDICISLHQFKRSGFSHSILRM